MRIVNFISGYIRFISILFIPVYFLITFFYVFQVSTTTRWTMAHFIELNDLFNSQRPIPIFLFWIILFISSDRIHEKTKSIKIETETEASQ